VSEKLNELPNEEMDGLAQMVKRTGGQISGYSNDDCMLEFASWLKHELTWMSCAREVGIS
jgi:hypothetical protein